MVTNPMSCAEKSVTQPQFYDTSFLSPQLELFELDEAEWRRAWLRPPYIRRQIQGPLAKQLNLFGLDMLLWFFFMQALNRGNLC